MKKTQILYLIIYILLLTNLWQWTASNKLELNVDENRTSQIEESADVSFTKKTACQNICTDAYALRTNVDTRGIYLTPKFGYHPDTDSCYFSSVWVWPDEQENYQIREITNCQTNEEVATYTLYEGVVQDCSNCVSEYEFIQLESSLLGF